MRARLLYLAARSAWLAAQSGRARALVEAAAGSAREIGLRADILRLRARIEWNTGSVHVGHRIVLEAAVEAAPHDPQRAREMAMFAAALASFGARSGIGAKPTDLVPPPEPDSPARVRCFSDLLYGLDAFSRREWAAGAPFLRRAFALADELEPDDLDLLPNLGIAALHCGDDELTLRFHDALLVRARSTGAIVMILYSLTRRSLAEIATGRWNAAAASASEALPLAANSGQRGLAAFPTAVLALIAALRGDAGTERHLAEVERITGSQPLGILVDVVADVVRWARGVREWTDAPQAVHHFEQISHPISRRLAAIDRLDSARRAERLDLLREWTLELDQFAEATGASSTIAAAQHGHALLTDGPDAEKHFLRSLEEHSRTGRAPDRARTQLAYGEFLRRSRRRVDARTHLREALDAFDDLGAVQWAERARQELRASGETARRRDVSTVTDLTPQEMNVARLVRQGLSNRDIAGQLFLSTRTIDFHLRNVFAKVGVSSRTELAALPLD
jgi:DNA-binding CsgD family transcriptional regulator